MPYRGGGCQTCKTRRVKCDQTKPTCQRCRKVKRTCSWQDDSHGELLIHLENDFATGNVKRPRGPRSALTKPVNTLASDVPRPLLFDLRARAIGFYFHHQMVPHQAPPEDAKSMSQTLLDIISNWMLKPNSQIVDLAIGPLALAVFSQKQRYERAATIASANYLQLLQRTQSTLSTLTEADIEASLIAVFLMGRYEDAVYDPNMSTGPPFVNTIKSFLHHKGALAILKVWKDNFSSHQAPTEIITQSRRGIIWTAILENGPLPPWICDGSAFGEHGLDLEYDRVLVHLAEVRHQFALLLGAFAPDVKSSQLVADARALYREAGEIDEEWEGYKSKYPPHWNFWTYDLTEQRNYPTHFIFSPTVHIFENYTYGLLWNRYYSTRMLINSTRLIISRYCSPETDQHIAHTQLDCISHIRNMAGAFAASIPYCLQQLHVVTKSDAAAREHVELHENKDLNQYLGNMVSWPLLIAASISSVDFRESAWFKALLTTIGKLAGVAFFQYAESEDWLKL